MMIANKEQKDEVVEYVAEYILMRQNLNREGDLMCRICNEELYNFLDLVFTIANEYHYNTGYEIRRRVVDELYDIKTRAYNTKGIQIYFYDLSFLDMKYLYEEYNKLGCAVQQHAKINAGLV